ncbi:ABC transporter substrate-binding protein [Paenibacillus sp. CF384]|uniref:ABC transporter substrate-binding protein n=1 Tax=Paenibacillus sp. CF384 TaxID=1884382 RepID=UPI00089AFAEC|nr:extracellular solute-binding protein [Paenibacillus sp. CF384]SDW87442.1 ABC-type glycerol-3-phosphate transport system, substrate-binding protein [Paenibacillus sp. CF384]
MSRRKYVMLLLSVFTICAALLVPMFGKPGSPVTHSDDGQLSTDKPEVVDGDEQDRTTLSIAVSMDETEYQYWQDENERFKLSHPRISIQMTNIHNEDADEARKKAAENGEPFDLMLLDNDRVREFAVQGFLLPVDDIVSGDTAADQMEALTSIVKWNGSLWGVPLDCNPLLVVWQKNILKDAGLSAPPKDLEALKAAVATVVATNPQISPFNLNTADPKEMAAWMGMFKENSEAAANLSPFTITQKEQLYYAAESAAQIYRLAPAQQKNQLLGAFGAGTLLSAIMPWTLYRSLSNEERGLLTIGSTTGPVVRANGRSFVMLAGTERLSEANAYITEMTTTESQLDHYRSLGRLPSRISAMTNEFEYSDIDKRPPHFLVGMLSRASVTPDPSWRERWERWSKLLVTLGGNQTLLSPELASTFISQWNGVPERPIGDAEAPPEEPSETDAKLNQ